MSVFEYNCLKGGDDPTTNYVWFSDDKQKMDFRNIQDNGTNKFKINPDGSIPINSYSTKPLNMGIEINPEGKKF